MTIFTTEKLYQAYLQCLKNKKGTVNALKFEVNREENLWALLRDLRSRRYQISRHICFVVTEPSPREIFAGHFRDRIVQHLLCNEIEAIFEADFTASSYANRKGKGTHRAVKKLEWYVRRGGRDREPLYFLKMDVKGFFRNMDKEILWDLIFNKVKQSGRPDWWKDEVLWLARKIIFHYPGDDYLFKGVKGSHNLIPREKSLLFGDKSKGLPIGNLTSQFFANVYLDKLDHFIKRDLGFSRYLRYVDDFVILAEDYERLLAANKQVNYFLQTCLRLGLCHDKTILRRVDFGIDFLGYFVKPTHTLVRRKVVKRFKACLYRMRGAKDNLISAADLPLVRSYLGHFSHACSFNLRCKLSLA